MVVREGRKLHREKVGKNRKTAERALRKIGTQVDEGAYRPQKTIRFHAEWADQWLASLERKATTVNSYRSTIAYAKEVFGDRVVRRLSVDDVAAFNTYLRDLEAGRAGARRMSASTRGKHLRVLNACLAAAVAHGYAPTNPVASCRRRSAHRPASGSGVLRDRRTGTGVRSPNPRRLPNDLRVALKTGARQGS